MDKYDHLENNAEEQRDYSKDDIHIYEDGSVNCPRCGEPNEPYRDEDFCIMCWADSSDNVYESIKDDMVGLG